MPEPTNKPSETNLTESNVKKNRVRLNEFEIEKIAKETYERMKQDVDISHILISCKEFSLPADTLLPARPEYSYNYPQNSPLAPSILKTTTKLLMKNGVARLAGTVCNQIPTNFKSKNGGCL